MTKQLNRKTTHRVDRPNPRGVFDGLVLRLCRAVRALHESEESVGNGIYRQSPHLRLVIRDTAEQLEHSLTGGAR